MEDFLPLRPALVAARTKNPAEAGLDGTGGAESLVTYVLRADHISNMTNGEQVIAEIGERVFVKVGLLHSPLQRLRLCG